MSLVHDDEDGLSAGASLPEEQPKISVDIDWSQVNLDEIELPEGEDFDIKSDDGENEEGSLEQDSGFGNIIVVDNLPVVPPEKFEKLQTVVRKIFGQIGNIREDGLFMPVDEESKKSKGYGFIEYTTPEEARAAREQTDGYKLDKSHVFRVCMFDDFEKYGKIPDEYMPPEVKEHVPSENTQSWLMDERARDQFVIRFGSETEVYWNDARQGKPDPEYRRTFWTESFVQWSPLGSYLTTVHRQGAAVWGGPSWARIMRFAHPQVRLLDFSPCERFLLTYSSHEPANPRDTQKVSINVFDIRSGKSLRDFKGPADDFATGGGGGVAGVQWPVFKWAGGCNDRYFARLGKNSISVYESSSMGLLDKRSLKVEGVVDFCWSPAEPLLALFVPEANGGNQPAKVSLIQIPSRTEVRQKNLFSVSDCKMFWQSAGQYLAVRVDRYTKTKRSTYSGFELFRIRDRDIPIEVLELENKNDKILDFSWEPKGHRFAIVHGDGPRPDVSFYSMTRTSTSSASASTSSTGVASFAAAASGGAGGGATGAAGAASTAAANAAAVSGGGSIQRVVKLGTLKGKQVNSVVWSPLGRFAVLAGLKGFNGQLEFFNVDEMESMGTGEHFMATDVDWDPSGRYVATSVASVHQMETGFNIWSFQGKLLYRLPRDGFLQFLWRPRPASLLPAEKEAEIAKTLKRYSKKYEAEDEEAGQASNAAELERRRKVMEAWKARVAAWKAEEDGEEGERSVLWGVGKGPKAESKEEYQAEEVEVEEIIDVQEEMMSFEGGGGL